MTKADSGQFHPQHPKDAGLHYDDDEEEEEWEEEDESGYCGSCADNAEFLGPFLGGGGVV